MDARIHEQKGEYRQAGEAIKTYFSYHDSLLNESVIDRATRLEMAYKTDSIRRNLELQRYQTRVKMHIALGVVLAIMILFILLYLNRQQRLRRTEAENKILEKDLETRNKELTTNVMYRIRKNESMLEITGRLEALQEG